MGGRRPDPHKVRDIASEPAIWDTRKPEVKSMPSMPSVPWVQSESEAGRSRPNTGYPRFSPGSSGWVVEVMFRPGIPGTTARERPVYWHGLENGGCHASDLNSDVAVFDSEALAIAIFRSAALPLPLIASRWRAVSIEEALAHGEELPATYSWGGGYVVSQEP
jgi:hypothetical protein